MLTLPANEISEPAQYWYYISQGKCGAKFHFSFISTITISLLPLHHSSATIDMLVSLGNIIKVRQCFQISIETLNTLFYSFIRFCHWELTLSRSILKGLIKFRCYCNYQSNANNPTSAKRQETKTHMHVCMHVRGSSRRHLPKVSTSRTEPENMREASLLTPPDLHFISRY